MTAEEAEAVLLREGEASFAYGALHATAVDYKAAAAEIWGSFCQIFDGGRGIWCGYGTDIVEVRIKDYIR